MVQAGSSVQIAREAPPDFLLSLPHRGKKTKKHGHKNLLLKVKSVLKFCFACSFQTYYSLSLNLSQLELCSLLSFSLSLQA